VVNGDNNEWTGKNEWRKQAARGAPPMVGKSLNNGIDVTDSAILLASNYVTLLDLRKTTDVAREAPASLSWGGNAGLYIQHKAEGTCGQYGTLTVGIRAQMETTQKKGAGNINDACAGYFGLYNNGEDVGGFGFHVDAYHAGVERIGHSTYAMSAECWKEQTAGRMVSYVARSQKGKVDYGLTVLHSGTGSFGRGIQLGNPSYGGGGVQGAPGVPTQFDVGVDLSWGDYTHASLMLRADSFLILSGYPQAQHSTPVDVCQMKFDGTTGMFAVQNGPMHKFDVNMTTGVIWQNGAPTWAAFSPSVRWAFSVGPGKTVPDHAGRTPAKWLRVEVDGEEFLMPLYRP